MSIDAGVNVREKVWDTVEHNRVWASVKDGTTDKVWEYARIRLCVPIARSTDGSMRDGLRAGVEQEGIHG